MRYLLSLQQLESERSFIDAPLSLSTASPIICLPSTYSAGIC